MNRRAFLTTLSAFAATAALDPERLLWRPTKTIFIPPAPGLAFHRDAFSLSAIDLPLPITIGPMYSIEFDFNESELIGSLERVPFDRVTRAWANYFDNIAARRAREILGH